MLGSTMRKSAKPKKGKVVVWGWNNFCQLGLEDHEDRSTPTETTKLNTKNKIVFITCGDNFSAAITDKGRVYTWGLGNDGQLGQNDKETGSFPREIVALRKNTMITVACGENHALYLSKKFVMYSVGDGDNGKLGHGDKQSLAIPRKLNLKKKVVGISCGSQHSAALTENNIVLTWGYGQGRLGLGDEKSCSTPREVESLYNYEIKQVCCGSNWTAVIAGDGRVLTFGVGSYGRLGHGNDINVLVPKIVEDVGAGVILISCGSDHMAALTGEGDVYTWGCGGNGRLGHGSELDIKKPQRVEALSHVIYISCGGYHMGAISERRTIFLWGWNLYGQCGIPSSGSSDEDIRVPTQLENLRNVVTLSCGESHTIALISDEKK